MKDDMERRLREEGRERERVEDEEGHYNSAPTEGS